MIFVTLGNQNFQFNRLLKELEKNITNGVIKEKVIAQVGYSEFKSELFTTIDFLGKDEFDGYIEDARFVLSHAGTGSIITCLNKNKKVIVAARLSKYSEHIDDHQKEILEALSAKNLIIKLDYELIDLKDKIENIDSISTSKFISNNKSFNRDLIEIIEAL